MSKRRLAASLAALSLTASGAVWAQSTDNYPSKPISLLIGFAPGGPTDAIGRVLFRKVSELLGQPIVIENRPGAGGNIAAAELLRTAPDGYKLMYGTSSVTTAPALFSRDDLNPGKAFVAAGCSVAVPLILLVSKSNKAPDARAFYGEIKQDPQRYFMGTSGNGSVDHLVGMEIADKLDVNAETVPYSGNGPALTDLAGGNTGFMYSGSFNSAMPFIQSGQVRALAVTSAHRSEALPDVPTLSESVPGLESFDAGTWQVLLAPKGTPTPILHKLNDALQTALKDPDVLTSLRFQGAEAMDMTPEQCQQYVDAEFVRWTATVERLGLKLN
ncbi:Bug family tripartite tricarboxylate transporter substrate binding protein [Verticiella sediminum]|nr:tripartite tricarboxylate transporter substrate binding protein [Verticiella sediminum]